MTAAQNAAILKKTGDLLSRRELASLTIPIVFGAGVTPKFPRGNAEFSTG